MKFIVSNVKVLCTSDVMFESKSSLDYTKLFSVNGCKKNDKITHKYFK